MNMIIIIGSGGSGKSTLAKELCTKLRIDVYHLDALFWKPDWVSVTKDEQINMLNDLIKKKNGSMMEIITAQSILD